MAKVVVEEKAHQSNRTMKEVNVDLHMILVLLVLYCLVVVEEEEVAIQVVLVVTEVGPFYFMQRRLL